MESSGIRRRFTDYFRSKGHVPLPSAPLVPAEDPSLLFTNAGMVPFKDQLTGRSRPAERRAVTIQKCVRAGGKHNDLEHVGFTAWHHTFFEMMGNFSFGDYFKEEAIAMAWEFLTRELGFPEDRLYVTVHEKDGESADLWRRKVGVPRERLFAKGDADNFWEMAETGPCGPCSEIFLRHGPAPGAAPGAAPAAACPVDDGDSCVEIWNLVFMQSERYREGGEVRTRPLPVPCVDTGAGLERVAAALQGRRNSYDSDLFAGIIGRIEELSGKSYRDHPRWMRVAADHARSATMLLADGVLPSNEGRGYVLRRIVRRAVRHLDLLCGDRAPFSELADPVLDALGGEYPDARAARDCVVRYLGLEEEAFRRTLGAGLALLEEEVARLGREGGGRLPGRKAFELYDTHGLPMDLTRMILRERGLSLDEEGFEGEMAKRREDSRKGCSFSAGDGAAAEAFHRLREAGGATVFTGHESLEERASLVGTAPLPGCGAALVFDRTPFYAEGGGQRGDTGEIRGPDGAVLRVVDAQAPVEGLVAHVVEADPGLPEGAECVLAVDGEARRRTMGHHTATHLLQAALARVLGGHVRQAGSGVGPDGLRFDFTHPGAPSKEEVARVEALVNAEIAKRTPVVPRTMGRKEAVEMGAVALFGEKYGDEVRVIDVPGFSLELCGGTHVENTGDVGLFAVVSEGSLASGVRRIEAVAGEAARLHLAGRSALLAGVEEELGAKGGDLLDRVRRLRGEAKSLGKEAASLRARLRRTEALGLAERADAGVDAGAADIGGGLVFRHVEAGADDDARSLGDLFVERDRRVVVLITQERRGKTAALLKTDRRNGAIDCAAVLGAVLGAMGGRGGGRPDMAQGSLGEGRRASDLAGEVAGEAARSIGRGA